MPVPPGGASASGINSEGRKSSMSQVVASKGSWLLKALGIITLVGVVIAVGRIVMKVFNEDEGGDPDASNGV